MGTGRNIGGGLGLGMSDSDDSEPVDPNGSNESGSFNVSWERLSAWLGCTTGQHKPIAMSLRDYWGRSGATSYGGTVLDPTRLRLPFCYVNILAPDGKQRYSGVQAAEFRRVYRPLESTSVLLIRVSVFSRRDVRRPICLCDDAMR